MPNVFEVREIDCGDVVLRQYREDDAEALSRAIEESADHLRPWMPWVTEDPQPVSVRLDYIVQTNRSWDAGGDMSFGMFRGESVVGGCGLHRRRGPRCLEIGYWVHVDHVGKGYATEAARALTTAAFSLPDVEWVEIHHDEANGRSRRVPEKLGYRLVSVQPDEKSAPGEVGVDCTWRMPRADWRL